MQPYQTHSKQGKKKNFSAGARGTKATMLPRIAPTGGVKTNMKKLKKTINKKSK